MKRFFYKRQQENFYFNNRKEPVIIENNEKKENYMDTQEKIKLAKEVLKNNEKEQSTIKVKKIKKDKGLIERTESSLTILTEDNKELLKD